MQLYFQAPACNTPSTPLRPQTELSIALFVWEGVWVLSGYCLGHFACCQRPIMSKQVRKAKIVLCCSAGALLSTTVCLVVVWGVWVLSEESQIMS